MSVVKRQLDDILDRMRMMHGGTENAVKFYEKAIIRNIKNGSFNGVIQNIIILKYFKEHYCGEV